MHSEHPVHFSSSIVIIFLTIVSPGHWFRFIVLILICHKIIGGTLIRIKKTRERCIVEKDRTIEMDNSVTGFNCRQNYIDKNGVKIYFGFPIVKTTE